MRKTQGSSLIPGHLAWRGEPGLGGGEPEVMGRGAGGTRWFPGEQVASTVTEQPQAAWWIWFLRGHLRRRGHCRSQGPRPAGGWSHRRPLALVLDLLGQARNLSAHCTAHPCPPLAPPPMLPSVPTSPSPLTRPSLWSARVQASMKVCAMTRSTASMLSDVCTSNTNCGFFIMLIQNLRGRLWAGRARPMSVLGRQETPRTPRPPGPGPTPTCWSSRCARCPGRRCRAAGPAHPAGRRST